MEYFYNKYTGQTILCLTKSTPYQESMHITLQSTKDAMIQHVKQHFTLKMSMLSNHRIFGHRIQSIKILL